MAPRVLLPTHPLRCVDEVFADELSDYIDDIVTEEFHMMCEDNSCEQVRCGACETVL